MLRHHRGDARRYHAGKGGAYRKEDGGGLGEMVDIEVEKIKDRHHENAAADA